MLLSRIPFDVIHWLVRIHVTLLALLTWGSFIACLPQRIQPAASPWVVVYIKALHLGLYLATWTLAMVSLEWRIRVTDYFVYITVSYLGSYVIHWLCVGVTELIVYCRQRRGRPSPVLSQDKLSSEHKALVIRVAAVGWIVYPCTGIVHTLLLLSASARSADTVGWLVPLLILFPLNSVIWTAVAAWVAARWYESAGAHRLRLYLVFTCLFQYLTLVVLMWAPLLPLSFNTQTVSAGPTVWSLLFASLTSATAVLGTLAQGFGLYSLHTARKVKVK